VTESEQNKKIYQSALHSLRRREHSTKELQTKLSQKGFEQALINQVLVQLTNENYLSDRRFSECFIRSQISKGYGPNHIKQALSHKGIENELIREALDEAEVDWMEQARRVFAKKFSNGSVDLLTQQKQKRFMLYKGFESECVNRLFKDEE
jgi:regulatory protein